MKTKAYVIVSALIFTVVALLHLLRLIEGWPVQMGTWIVPAGASLLGLVIAGGVAMWGFSLLRRKV